MEGNFMKQFKVFLCSFLFLFVFSSSGFSYTDKINFSGFTGIGFEGPVFTGLFGNTFTYRHSLPFDFQVPYDEVKSADLTISGYYIDSGDDVYIDGETFGSLNEGGSYELRFSWEKGIFLKDNPSVSNFDIASAFNVWETGKFLDVSITNTSGKFMDLGFYLSKSVFNLDYEYKIAHAPEPSTMVLFGLGLLGFGVVGRKKLVNN